MPSNIQLGMEGGEHSKDLGSHPGGGKSPLHSQLVTNTCLPHLLVPHGHTVAGLT